MKRKGVRRGGGKGGRKGGEERGVGEKTLGLAI